MDLYHINKDYAEIVGQLFENGGELTPEIKELMAQNSEDFNEKGENYMKAIRNLEADVERFKTEADFFTNKKKSAEKTIDTLKRTMVKAMELRGIEKTNFGNFKASLRKSESVQITDEFFFEGNRKYIRTTTKEEPDKVAIKEALKNKIDIVGARLEEKNSLQIK